MTTYREFIIGQCDWWMMCCVNGLVESPSVVKVLADDMASFKKLLQNLSDGELPRDEFIDKHWTESDLAQHRETLEKMRQRGV